MPTVPPSRAAPLIERAPLPMVEVQGIDHVVTNASPAFCHLLGKSRADIVGQSFRDLVRGADECVPLLDDVYETGRAKTHAVTEDGDDPTAWLYAMWPALDPEQRPEAVIITVSRVANYRATVTAVNERLLVAGLEQQEGREAALATNLQLEAEITERKRVESELKDAVAALALMNRNKDEFLAMLAHELRNPLAPIKNAAQILRLAESPDATIQRAQAIIERQADHLANLVDGLLDMSRIQQGKISVVKVPLDLARAVRRAVESCAPLFDQHRHTVTLDLPVDQRMTVEADPTRIDQVLVNLLNNAAKYTRSGGAIHVKVAREGAMVVARIRDNGIGIAPEDLQRVFELFAQVDTSLERRQGGLGLGLKLVKQIVALHGGDVHALSEGLGHGCELVVRLPAVDARPMRADSGRQAAAAPTVARRILVVDDSPDNRETMKILLTMLGHSVELAEDGEQAVEKALHEGYDVAFVDIGLPGLSGYQVAQAIRKQPAGEQVVLIALSGYGQAEDKRKALEVGFDAHLTKPVMAGTFAPILADLGKFNR